MHIYRLQAFEYACIRFQFPKSSIIIKQHHAIRKGENFIQRLNGNVLPRQLLSLSRLT
jgi:hypothetical protein